MVRILTSVAFAVAVLLAMVTKTEPHAFWQWLGCFSAALLTLTAVHLVLTDWEDQQREHRLDQQIREEAARAQASRPQASKITGYTPQGAARRESVPGGTRRV